MATCVLCGCEIGFLGQYVVHLCSTEQPLCKQCITRYERADDFEKPRIRERILASPHLRKREQVMEYLAAERINAQRREREEAERIQHLEDLTSRMKTVLRCCNVPMTCLGRGRYTQFSDTLLVSMRERPVTVFECPVCGQVKFFNPDFIPAALLEKEETNG